MKWFSGSLLYTNENIGDRLAMRNLLDDLRSGGMSTGGPAPRLQRSVMRATMGRNAGHSGVLDSQLLLQQRDLVLQTVDLGPDPGPAVPVVRGPGDQDSERVMAQGEGRGSFGAIGTSARLWGVSRRL